MLFEGLSERPFKAFFAAALKTSANFFAFASICVALSSGVPFEFLDQSLIAEPEEKCVRNWKLQEQMHIFFFWGKATQGDAKSENRRAIVLD